MAKKSKMSVIDRILANDPRKNGGKVVNVVNSLELESEEPVQYLAEHVARVLKEMKLQAQSYPILKKLRKKLLQALECEGTPNSHLEWYEAVDVAKVGEVFDQIWSRSGPEGSSKLKSLVSGCLDWFDPNYSPRDHGVEYRPYSVVFRGTPDEIDAAIARIDQVLCEEPTLQDSPSAAPTEDTNAPTKKKSSASPRKATKARKKKGQGEVSGG